MRKRIGSLILAVILMLTTTIYALAEENYTMLFSLSKESYKLDDYVHGTGKVLKGKSVAKSIPITVIVEDSSGNSVFEVEQYKTKEDGEFEVDFKMPYGTIDGTYTMSLKTFDTEKIIDFDIKSQDEYRIDFTLNKTEYMVDEYIQGNGQVFLGETVASKVPVTLVIEDETGKSVLLTEQYTTDANGNFQTNLKMPYGTTEGLYVMKLKAFDEEKKVTLEIKEDSLSIELERIDINSSLVKVKEEETLQLELTGKMNDGTVAPGDELEGAIWSSSDELVAEVDNTGLVTAMAEGTATITVKVGKLVDEIEITVQKKEELIELENITIEANSTEVKEEEMLQLELTGKMSDRTTAPDSELEGAMWSSSDDSIAEVDSTGLVTAKAKGSVKISVKVGELTDEIEITVQVKETTNDDSSSRKSNKSKEETKQGTKTTTRDRQGNKVVKFEIDTKKMEEQIEDKDSNTITIGAVSEEVDTVSVSMDSELVSKAKQKGKKLEVNIGSVVIEIESDGIEVEKGSKLELKVNKLKLEKAEEVISKKESNEFNSVSQVFNFELNVIKGENTQKLQFDKPLTITVRYDADKVSNPEKIGIYYYNEETGNWEYVGGKANADGTIIFKVEHFSKYAAMEYNKKFVDVDMLWASKEIEVLTAKHIINGVDDMNFTPNRYITRAEFSKLIVKALDLKLGEKTVDFTDVETDKWYTKPIEIVASLGIVTGSDGRFNPNDAITREEMATMVVRALKYMDPEEYIIADTDFVDKEEISIWAKETVAISEHKGLINGTEENKFAPKKTTSRAEAAVVIYRLLKLLSRI